MEILCVTAAGHKQLGGQGQLSKILNIPYTVEMSRARFLIRLKYWTVIVQPALISSIRDFAIRATSARRSPPTPSMPKCEYAQATLVKFCLTTSYNILQRITKSPRHLIKHHQTTWGSAISMRSTDQTTAICSIGSC